MIKEKQLGKPDHLDNTGEHLKHSQVSAAPDENKTQQRVHDVLMGFQTLLVLAAFLSCSQCHDQVAAPPTTIENKTTILLENPLASCQRLPQEAEHLQESPPLCCRASAHDQHHDDGNDLLTASASNNPVERDAVLICNQPPTGLE